MPLKSPLPLNPAAELQEVIAEDVEDVVVDSLVTMKVHLFARTYIAQIMVSLRWAKPC